jgi:hypothetical protein
LICDDFEQLSNDYGEFGRRVEHVLKEDVAIVPYDAPWPEIREEKGTC